MKYPYAGDLFLPLVSLPARGARIEMFEVMTGSAEKATSLPARGARIEIPQHCLMWHPMFVAPRTGSED